MRSPLRKIDRLLIREFIPPFVLACGIALFVLMMQFLWLWIDDIAGKGIGFFVLAEMLYYLGITLVPMALPIGVLLASVMVYGNLAEKYELASLKSAGIPLMRIMLSSMALSAIIALGSFFCSNNFIPYANLKFRSRLYDIKKQKPALNIEEGVFNDDFQGYTIRIGKKSINNRNIEDIMIDDNESNNRQELNLVRAEKGEMFITDDDRFFVMQLENGYQYQETGPGAASNQHPFVRMKFKDYTKAFDLSEFDLSRTDESIFKSYHAMLSSSQLKEAIDSISNVISKMDVELKADMENKMYFLIYKEELDSTTRQDTSFYVFPEMRKDTVAKPQKISVAPDRVLEQPYLDDLLPGQSIVLSFSETKQVELLTKARNIVRASKNFLYEHRQRLQYEREKRVKHIYELHSKYGLALICFIFLFIGAPMGAIVRKGGFGWPFLVAILFFMLFVILMIFFRRLARSLAIDPVLGAWMPNIILFPIGLFLTVKAMNDSKLLDTGKWITPFKNFLSRKMKANGLE
jgi:lipopolysaccharide export system permease protein